MDDCSNTGFDYKTMLLMQKTMGYSIKCLLAYIIFMKLPLFSWDQSTRMRQIYVKVYCMLIASDLKQPLRNLTFRVSSTAVM